MAWRDDLLALKKDLDTALARTMGEPVDEDPDSEREREELYQLAASLQVAQMLVDLNEAVLGGAGRVESTSLMDYYDDDDEVFEMEDEDELEEDEGTLEEGVEVRFSLVWDDVTECAVDVELGKTNGRICLLVNGEEVRQQREVLETAVLDAFRDEMDLD
jgi:hypothetical protein